MFDEQLYYYDKYHIKNLIIIDNEKIVLMDLLALAKKISSTG